MIDRATEYAKAVAGRKILACEWVRLACRRHLADLKRRDLVWDAAAADRIIRFAGKFRHYKGQWAGQIFRVEPWQAFILGSLFGWKHLDGRRRFSHAYIEVPRKNGKTFFASVIGLYMLCADKEGGAEVYAAATKADQAKIVWKDACKLIQRSKDKGFIAKFDIRKNPAVIEHLDSDSVFSPLSREASNLDGLNPHCIIADELHAWKDAELWNVLNSALGARHQPLFVQITTAGYLTEGVCRDQQRHVQSVLRGDYDNDGYFGIIYTTDKSDSPHDERAWQKANPNWGVSVLVESMRSAYKLAKPKPTTWIDFEVKRLNRWATASKGWLNMLRWADCAFGDVEIESLKGKRCFAGLDLAQVNDLSALVLLFPPQDGVPRWTVLPFFWCPEDDIDERSTQARVPYRDWVEQGLIEATPGNVTDYNFIEAKIVEIARIYDIKSIAFDRTFSGAIMQNLQT